MPDPRKPTKSPRAEDIVRSWYLLDGRDKVFGRAASQVAHILMGKHNSHYAPHVDTGDFVIVVNARHLRLTGRKAEQKIYHHHTGYTGHLRSFSAGKLMAKEPEKLFRQAVGGMLPKTALGKHMLTKLKVYAEGDHPHAAQRPQPLEVRA